MGNRQKLNGDAGNWETVAFIYIRKVLHGNNPYFERQDLVRLDYFDLAVDLTTVLGHKKRPKKPEETFQRTLQNMRDKGHIEFLGAGNYKLTPSGFAEMEELAGRFDFDELKKATTRIKKGGPLD